MALDKGENQIQVKNPFIKISGILFMAILIYAGCSNSSSSEKQKQDSTDSMAQSKQTASQTTDTVVKYQIIKEHESVRDEWKQEVADNEKRISDLGDRISNEEKKMRDKDKERLDELKERNDQLKVSIDEYKEDGEQAWLNFKNKTDTDAKNLGEDLDALGNSVVKVVTGKNKK